METVRIFEEEKEEKAEVKSFDMDSVRSMVRQMSEIDDQIAELRSHLVGELDKIRDLLEEISSEVGLTDPASGPVIWTN